MKRPDAIANLTPSTTWIPFITKVLAFIGLWQVLSNSASLLARWL